MYIHHIVSSDELFWHNSSANIANVAGFCTLSHWEMCGTSQRPSEPNPITLALFAEELCQNSSSEDTIWWLYTIVGLCNIRCGLDPPLLKQVRIRSFWLETWCNHKTIENFILKPRLFISWIESFNLKYFLKSVNNTIEELGSVKR